MKKLILVCILLMLGLNTITYTQQQQSLFEEPTHNHYAVIKEDVFYPTTSVKRYIDRFYPLIKELNKNTNIPNIIIMAQTIIETGWGDSYIFKHGKAMFGHKCFRDICKLDPKIGPHCINASDDHDHDRFKRYNTYRESIQSHIELLTSDKYTNLHCLSKDDIEGWAKGLNVKFATNPNYDKDILKVVKSIIRRL